MVHGLASKPPKKDLHKFWRSCLIENIKLFDPELGTALSGKPSTFESAYWANATPHHIEDDEEYVGKLEIQVSKTIQERKDLAKKAMEEASEGGRARVRKEIDHGFHAPRGTKVSAFFKSRGLDLVNVVTGALRVKDDVMNMFLRETELYSKDQYIADQMRDPLEKALRKAWNDNCEVALLSHSMGTFISYDVLWRFSHRDVVGYREFRDKRVKMFVTMGSPLGDSAVRDMLFARYHEKSGDREYPTNVDLWHNYACLGDVVSHQHNFDKAFFAGMRREGIFPKAPPHRAIDYEKLYNPFKVVSHKGNQGKEKQNPHKSYGYLVQPRLGSWLVDFLRGDLKLGTGGKKKAMRKKRG